VNKIPILLLSLFLLAATVGVAYARTGNRTGAMQQYYVLQNLNPRVAADLLTIIPK